MNGLPRLYDKYIGHDDNRDFYMSNMTETTNMNRQLFLEWFPQIMYNHHQTGPAGAVIFIPPFRDPFNYNFDPLVPLGIEMVGTAMHSRLVAEGKGGSAMRSGANYSTWWNGGLRTVTYFHNMIGILTEIIGNPDADATFRWSPDKQLAAGRLAAADRAAGRGTTASRSTTRSRNNRAILDLASRYRETLLFNIYRMGMNSIEKGSKDNWTITPKRIAALEAAAGGRCRSRRGGGRGGRGGRGGGGAAPRRAAMSPGGGTFGGAARAFPRSCTTPSCTTPRCAIRAATSFRPTRPISPPPPSSSTRCSRPASRSARATAAFQVAGKSYPAGSLRGEDRAGVPPARAGHVRAAGSSQRFRLSRRPAQSRPTTSPAGRSPCRWA